MLWRELPEQGSQTPLPPPKYRIVASSILERPMKKDAMSINATVLRASLEPLAKLWVDEWQSHFESIFGKQAALSGRAIGFYV